MAKLWTGWKKSATNSIRADVPQSRWTVGCFDGARLCAKHQSQCCGWSATQPRSKQSQKVHYRRLQNIGSKLQYQTMARRDMNPRNRKVDAVLSKAEKWRDEMEQLRTIVLDCGLTEELKWYQPCYTFQGKNIVLIHGFKDYCALLFMKGALLKDAKGILVQQTENVQAGRQIRFTSLREIVKLDPVLKAYIKEAIEVEKAGLKVELKETSEFKMPEEFQRKLNEMPALKTAFESLTPGRQRGYLLYFAGAKQSQTREARIEKCMDLIFDGKGLNDD